MSWVIGVCLGFIATMTNNIKDMLRGVDSFTLSSIILIIMNMTMTPK